MAIMEKHVAIIGAGISGILTCKKVLEKGFRPIVFESRSGLGGVWAKAIKSTILQSPKTYFEFSDFPWPASVETDYPPQQQVLEYLESYADHFDLVRHIKFNTKVMSVKYEGPSDEEMEAWSLWGGNGEPFSLGGKWKIEVEDTTTLLTQESYQVDFLICCTGMFSDVPNIPEFLIDKDLSTFNGTVLHSKDYAAMDHEMAAKFIQGKRVTVVGFHKTAIDVALECSTANGTENPCTLLYKTKHWYTPDHHPWGISITDFFLNRFSEHFLHKPGEGYLASIVATLANPLRWAFSKLVEADIKRKLPMAKYGMVPKHSYMEELASCSIATMPMNFYDKVEEGSLILKKAESFGFYKEGVIVEPDNKPIQTDLVILATGFRGDQKLKEIFVSKTFRNYMNNGTSRTATPLYRGVIHPRIPQLAMIGYSESHGNLYTSEMRSRWVAELLDGTFKPPSIEKMEETMVKWDEFMTRQFGKFYKRSCFMMLHIFHNDILCKDMGWNPKRKKGFFADLFMAYRPTDYASP